MVEVEEEEETTFPLTISSTTTTIRLVVDEELLSKRRRSVCVCWTGVSHVTPHLDTSSPSSSLRYSAISSSRCVLMFSRVL